MKFKGYRIQLELLTVIVAMIYRLIDQSSIFKSIFIPATHRVPIVYYRSYTDNEPNFKFNLNAGQLIFVKYSNIQRPNVNCKFDWNRMINI